MSIFFFLQWNVASAYFYSAHHRTTTTGCSCINNSHSHSHTHSLSLSQSMQSCHFVPCPCPLRNRPLRTKQDDRPVFSTGRDIASITHLEVKCLLFFQGSETNVPTYLLSGLYEYWKQPITTKLPKTTENLKIPKTTSFFHLKTVFIVPQYICANI